MSPMHAFSIGKCWLRTLSCSVQKVFIFCWLYSLFASSHPQCMPDPPVSHSGVSPPAPSPGASDAPVLECLHGNSAMDPPCLHNVPLAALSSSHIGVYCIHSLRYLLRCHPCYDFSPLEREYLGAVPDKGLRSSSWSSAGANLYGGH